RRGAAAGRGAASPAERRVERVAVRPGGEAARPPGASRSPLSAAPAVDKVRTVNELCERAVDAAVSAGASYADARVVERRSQLVATRDGLVEAVDDSE